MNRVLFVFLIVSAGAHAQRSCVSANATRDVLRPCSAFYAGHCAVYDSLSSFASAHPDGTVTFGTWPPGSRVRDNVACFMPDGLAHPETGYVRFLVDQNGTQSTTSSDLDHAVCGSSYADNLFVAEYTTTCGAGTISPYSYGGNALELYGMGGDDFIWGGPGDDRFYGGAGEDQLTGRNGDDLLSGGNDHDTIQDWCQPGDVFYGDAGSDFLEAFFPIGNSGGCAMDGGDGDDTLRYEGGPQGTTAVCGDGDDSMIWKVVVTGEWSSCPADCEHFVSDPGLIEQPYGDMCTP